MTNVYKMITCIFCKIGSGEIPAHEIYEDEFSLAFLDIKPHARGHTVVIPKKHAVTVFGLSQEDLQKLMLSITKTMQRIQHVLNPDGFNVGWNHNTAGGQVVPHLHVLIFPRYLNDDGGSMHSIINNPGNESVESIAKMFQRK